MNPLRDPSKPLPQSILLAMHRKPALRQPDYGQNNPDGAAQSSVAQHPVRHEPVGPKAGEGSDTKGVHGRIGVRVTSYRRRLIDPDNLCPKYFIDACRYAGFIRDDSAQEIEFTAAQIKVTTKAEERTVIELTSLRGTNSQPAEPRNGDADAR